jgi:methylated-DNA-[protein]-cysteine S-methyltransferase
MSTLQLSFKTKFGFVSIIERKGYVTDINFSKNVKHKIDPKKSAIKNQIKNFFEGRKKEFNFKCKINGSTTQLKVWKEIKKIPYGMTTTYNNIAKKLNLHPRQIGRICGENKLLLHIPCHRVIRSDGSLGGYSSKGGTSLKKKILKIEELNK